MIKSMTGFGKSTVTVEGKSVVIEVRTLNSKQLDLNLKISPLFRDKENEIRTMVAQSLERGKVDVAIYIDKNESHALSINQELAKSYYQELLQLSTMLDVEASRNDIFQQVLKLPDVLVTPREELSTELWNAVSSAIQEALHHVVTFRIAEGEALSRDFICRVNLINEAVDEITPFESQRIQNQRNKFLSAFAEMKLNGQYDANRLEQEMIYFIEKLDITEEKVRLKKHCSYFLETMSEQAANGKKLGFIVQEMGREVNTIGSKCNDYHIQQIVVKMKDEVEKLKEQLANIL